MGPNVPGEMIEDTQARFDTGAEAWAAYNQQPLGRIRREVTWHILAQHLPSASGAARLPRVLDAGAGSGELVLRLAQHGYRVWGLDYAPAMLAQAGQSIQTLPSEIRDRVTLCAMAVDAAPETFEPGFFDAIVCHTLLEYLPDPRATLRSLADLLRDGGMLSVSFVNRHAEVMRQVWSGGDPAGALVRLEDGAFSATLFGIRGVAYTAEEVGTWLAELGLVLTATYGVRAFADYVPRERLQDADFFDALLRLEKAVAARVPYRLVARYVHLFAHKDSEPGSSTEMYQPTPGGGV